jgi:hypothetical protein
MGEGQSWEGEIIGSLANCHRSNQRGDKPDNYSRKKHCSQGEVTPVSFRWHAVLKASTVPVKGDRDSAQVMDENETTMVELVSLICFEDE